MRTWFVNVVAVILSVVIFLAIGLKVNAAKEEHMKENAEHQKGDMKDNHSHKPVPPTYKDKKNPHWTHLNDIVVGARIYKNSCMVCHGENGDGKGFLERSLNPKPANFTDTEMMAMASDDYLFWRVNEGGQTDSFNSAMPSFKDTLKENEIWQVLAYIHTFSHTYLLQHKPMEEGKHQ
ncbi:MAG: c-type cytochrome [Thermodesulfobacteriota bacterium]